MASTQAPEQLLLIRLENVVGSAVNNHGQLWSQILGQEFIWN